MSTETRFMFETDFDNPELLDSSERTYSEDDIEAARAEVRQATLAELRSLEEKRTADLAAEMSAKLGLLAGQRANDLQSATENAVDIAVAICQKILPTLAAQNALTEIEGHVARTLADVHGEPRVVVRVADENVAKLQRCVDGLTGGFDGQIVLLGDDQLTATDCHVMWADGGSDRDVQRTRAAINKVVEQITENSVYQKPDESAPVMAPEAEVSATDLSIDSNNLEQSSKVID